MILNVSETYFGGCLKYGHIDSWGLFPWPDKNKLKKQIDVSNVPLSINGETEQNLCE